MQINVTATKPPRLRMDLGPSKVPASLGRGRGLPVAKQSTLAGRPPNSGKRIFNSRSLNAPSASSRASCSCGRSGTITAGVREAHVFVCVLAYALWKTLDHLAKRAGLMTEIRKPDLRRPRSSPKARRMTPQVILRELRKIKIGDILMSTTDGQQLVLRRVARPGPGQARILEALKLALPERLASPDRIL